VKTETETAILELEAARRKAMLALDFEALRGLLDEDLHYGHSTGGTDSRESYLAKIAGGTNVYEKLDIAVERVVELADGAAMAIGTMKARVRLTDRTVDVHNSFITVWRRTHGRWQMVGHQTVSKLSRSQPDQKAYGI
jgi:hypothetical protein